MSDSKTGTIGWFDVTVEDADTLRDFYADVVGWTVDASDMGGYSDYTMMTPEDGTPVAGVCHARGTNAGLPAQWLMYITVADLDGSVARCEKRGGTVIAGPKVVGEYGRVCVIKDPAGAVAALFEPS